MVHLLVPAELVSTIVMEARLMSSVVANSRPMNCSFTVPEMVVGLAMRLETYCLSSVVLSAVDGELRVLPVVMDDAPFFLTISRTRTVAAEPDDHAPNTAGVTSPAVVAEK